MPALTALLVLITVLALIPTPTRALHRLNSPTPQRRHQLTLPTRGRPHLSANAFARSTRRRLTALAAVVALGILIAASTDPSVLVIALTLAVIATLITTQRARTTRARATARKRAAVIEACDVLAAELAAGRPPSAALEGAATVCPDLEVASAAAKLGGDVPALLDLLAETPGNEGLRALSAAWRVADESGAAFATIIDRLADSLRADETIRRQITTSIAGPRATARLLAILPAFGTALGYAIGANPLAFLTQSPPGWLCLALGLALTTLGLYWTNTQTKPPWESTPSPRHQPT
ncbi:type II secretion system F family protein [Kribbella sp. NPDC056861]|uniref:type II secretion system F family protein n=1 Tax=Kribbella sp. NPDC056861 TaxID=3154857 RepID=UPI00342ECE4E